MPADFLDHTVVVCRLHPCSPFVEPFPLKVMELLEEKVGSGVFLEALTGVNMEISRKRVERKRQRAVEKATDPVAAAERRRERTEAGKVNLGS